MNKTSLPPSHASFHAGTQEPNVELARLLAERSHLRLLQDSNFCSIGHFQISFLLLGSILGNKNEFFIPQCLRRTYRQLDSLNFRQPPHPLSSFVVLLILLLLTSRIVKYHNRTTLPVTHLIDIIKQSNTISTQGKIQKLFHQISTVDFLY